ncbi:two-partner secretion domain-containing protein [Polaromonas glacialis]|uniref:two-partner secretion domain-containing protein n=1 Tax=Polaromonas glacialis TaxID=866564 RepID=UPI00068EA219|nr:MBG domain-containing protein [Polaromonas glacialis]
MNLIHRSIWNDQTGTFVAVSEITRGAGKKTSSCAAAADAGGSFRLKILAVSLMMACGASAYAQPAGGVVSAGSASIGGTTGNMTITQTTPNVAINWQSFGIKAGESVQFVQPGSNSVALNRVVGSDPSNILGSLSSNGKVFLVNPNGILFGQGASVNVGGLVASTLAISDANFMANNFKFSGAGAGSVLNQGTINAAIGGYVALLGANVSNQGVIAAQLGTVALAAGNAVTLDMAGDKLLNVTVDQGAVDALVDNGGMVRADGGQVLMTTQAAGSLLSNAVNNTGVVQAQTLVTGENGTIKLLGGMDSGTVNVAGTLDASAPIGGNGGFVETSAANVKVANGAKVTTLASAGKTGTWLIDPSDYTVAASGGNITGAQLGTNLDLTNVTLDSNSGGAGTAGNVNVNDAVSWTATTALTMNAVNDVNINQAITGINGSVIAKAGHDVNVAAATKTTTGNLTFNAVNDVKVTAATTITTGTLTAVAGKDVKIQAASTITSGDMVLRADNDGTGPGAAAGTVSITCGSNCLTITTGNLSIRFNPASYATTNAEITAYRSNLTGAGVLDAKAWVFGKGDNKMYDGTTTANVSGLKPDLAGVAPAATLGAVSNANFDTKHVGTDKLITFNSTFSNAVFDLFAPAGTTSGTYVTRADITARPLTVNAVTDTRVYNGTTSSTGTPTFLGLQPGDTLNGTLTQVYASKNVLGTGNSTLVANGPYTVSDGNGGNNYSVSVNTAPGTITPATLIGRITADDKMYDGNDSAVIASRTLATPFAGDSVTYTGGTAQFSDKNVGNGKTVTGTGLSLAGADAGNYTVNTTAITTASITPAPLTIKANDATKVYGQTFTPSGTAFTTPVAPVAGETVTSVAETSTGTAPTASVVGSTYPIAITPGSATGTFTPSNYTITYVDGALTVTPAPLTIKANDATKVYGQTFTPSGTAFTTPVATQNGETVGSVTELSPTGTPPTAAVPGPYAITPSAATGGTFTPSNYTITYVDGALTVTPAPLTIKANDATKVYGDTFTPSGTAFTTPVAPQNGETVGSVTELSPTGTPPTAAVPGPYAITPSAATGGTFTPSNYTITYVDGALTVTPAPLTIKANDATKVYGDTFTPSGTAFTTPVAPKNGETVGSVTETSPGSVATATAPGPYAITPTGATGGTFNPGNYVITYTDGQLTVTPVTVPPVVTPPVVVPPVVTPPVVTPPVVVPPVVTPPVVTPPVVVPPAITGSFPPPVIQPVPPAAIPPGPVPSIVPPALPVVVVPATLPPPVLRVVMPPAPIVVTPAETPVVTPVAAPPEAYVAPKRAPKPYRN